MKIEYQEVPADDVMRFWADGYGPAVKMVDWFWDGAKQKFIFKLSVKDDTASCNSCGRNRPCECAP